MPAVRRSGDGPYCDTTPRPRARSWRGAVTKPKVIEGTWEEITLRGPELAGHRVRVTVLDDPATPAAPTGRPGDTQIPGHLLDDDAIASCERAADDRVTLNQVRAGTASIQGSMARVVTEEERAERF